MSTVKVKNVQVGDSGTSSQNFTIYQPSTPDGTLRIGRGNSGGTTVDVIKVNADGGVNLNGPCFRAYAGSSQSVTTSTFTKVNINTESFDIGGCFNNTGSSAVLNGLTVPAYAFMPNVAGYYQVNGLVRIATTGSSQQIVSLYKNGTIYARGYDGGNTTTQMVLSEMVYLNGTTDYIELYGYSNGTSLSFDAANSAATSMFSAALVRAA